MTGRRGDEVLDAVALVTAYLEGEPNPWPADNPTQREKWESTRQDGLRTLRQVGMLRAGASRHPAGRKLRVVGGDR